LKHQGHQDAQANRQRAARNLASRLGRFAPRADLKIDGNDEGQAEHLGVLGVSNLLFLA